MILWFSGTGNSRLAAERLGEILNENVMEMPLLAPVINLNPEEKRVIWCFPTYSWGMPPVVDRFIAAVNIAEAENAGHYMLTTCGDDMAYTDRRWRKAIAARGWHAKGAYSVVMPNTYVLMKGFDVDSPEVAGAKLSAFPAAIKRVAEAILTDSADILVRGSFPWIKSYIIYPWFRRFAMSLAPFQALPACIGCGLCARMCPMKNISMNHGAPQWSDNCALCLRCYHICPQRAIAYGNKTKGKGQYNSLLHKN